MKEHAILFSDPMVRAILAGRKTTTRRVVMSKRRWELMRPGDLLWVREAWRPRGHGYEYRASALDPRGRRWHPSIFMPRDASRLTLQIVSVDQEMLQAISETQAKYEGADPDCLGSYREPFRQLWDELNGKRGFGWYRNPLVWVITFSRRLTTEAT